MCSSYWQINHDKSKSCNHFWSLMSKRSRLYYETIYNKIRIVFRTFLVPGQDNTESAEQTGVNCFLNIPIEVFGTFQHIMCL